MRILVDTSVWIDFLNDYPSQEQETLAGLLAGDDEICTCGVILTEVFQGLRRERGRKAFEALFRELTFLELAGMDPYFRAAELYRTLRQGGVTARSTIDCLIAITAELGGCRLLARDRDMTAIARSGLLQGFLLL